MWVAIDADLNQAYFDPNFHPPFILDIDKFGLVLVQFDIRQDMETFLPLTKDMMTVMLIPFEGN